MDLPEPLTPVTTVKRSERNHQVDILQIVDVRAEEAQEFSVGLVAAVGDRDAEFAAEIAAGDGLRLAQHRVVGAGEKQLAAEFAGAGAEIDDRIGGFDRVGIVLDDQNRVAEVAQRFEDVDQALGVARMQTDRRLVEHVERADEMRAERRGELDALGFAAGERGGEAVEREVVEADFVEELEARANFVEDFVGDFRLRWR